MTIEEARSWLINASLGITGAQMLFFLIAPAFGYPLQFSDSLNVLQIITPVFLGYLGSASHFIFATPVPDVPVINRHLGVLVKGPLLIYAAVVIGVVAAFGYTNRTAAGASGGMSVDNLSSALAVALGLLAVTTGVITSYLFVSGRQADRVVANNPTPKPGNG